MLLKHSLTFSNYLFVPTDGNFHQDLRLHLSRVYRSPTYTHRQINTFQIQHWLFLYQTACSIQVSKSSDLLQEVVCVILGTMDRSSR